MLLGSLASAAIITTPAAAVVTTFATYSATGGTNIRLENSGSAVGRMQDALVYSTSTPTATSAGAVTVNFSFLQAQLAPFITNVSALYTLNGIIATGSAASTLPSGLFQPGFSGSFSFLSVAPITVSGPGLTTTLYAAGSNLLSGTFSSGSISGSGTSGGTFASGPVAGGLITFSSDFLNFDDSIIFDRAQSLSAISPALQIGANGALRSFRGVAGGSFSADPTPKITAAVPEPESWALLILGFGIVGMAARRRRPRSLTA